MREYEFNSLVLPLAESLGQYAMQMRNTAERIVKEDGSPTTKIDIEIEKRFRDELANRFFGIGFVGEETSPNVPDKGLIFLLDPVDGTSNYLDMNSREGFAISGGLYDRDREKILYGFVHDIFNNVTYCNGDIWVNGRQNNRYHLDIPLRCHFQGSEDFKNAMTQEFSETGAQVYTHPYSTALRMCEAILGGEKARYMSNSNRIKPWDVAGGAGVAKALNVNVGGLEGRTFTVLNPAESGVVIRH